MRKLSWILALILVMSCCVAAQAGTAALTPKATSDGTYIPPSVNPPPPSAADDTPAANETADQSRVGTYSTVYAPLVGMDLEVDGIGFTITKIIPNEDGANARGELENGEDRERLLMTDFARHIYNLVRKPGKVFEENGRWTFWFKLRPALDVIRVRPGKLPVDPDKVRYTEWQQNEGTETHSRKMLYKINSYVTLTLDVQTEDCVASCSGVCSVCGGPVEGTHSGYTAKEYCFGTEYTTNCPDCGQYNRYVVRNGNDCAVKDAVLEEYSDCEAVLIGCPVCKYVYDYADGDNLHQDELKGTMTVDDFASSQQDLLTASTGYTAYLAQTGYTMPAWKPGADHVNIYQCSVCGRISYALVYLTDGWVSNGDGTHSCSGTVEDWFQAWGGAVDDTQPCTAGDDGTCTICHGAL